MFLMKGPRVFVVALIILAGDGFSDAAQRNKHLVEQELTKVRTDLTAAQQQITTKAKVLWQKQHDLEYNDPSISKLREEVVSLEKELLDKRRALDFKLSLVPEMKAIEKDRRQLFEQLETLRQEEVALQNELVALENAGALSEKSP